MLGTIPGGFALKPSDAEIINTQRAITKRINDDFIQVGAIYLKTSSKNPYDLAWFERKHRDVNLQEWIDDPEARLNNVGFNLQLGWVDIDIDAEDAGYNRCIVGALKHLRVDTRFAFGRHSVGTPTHVLVQLGEEEATNFEYLSRFEPKEYKIRGRRFHTQIRSAPVSAKPSFKEAKQTVMPGSIYTSKSNEEEYDLSVWYGGTGNTAKSVTDIATTTPHKVAFNDIVRAISFGTLAYVVAEKWVEGSRQNTAQKVAGWLARIVYQSQSINNHEGIADDVFCPIDSDDIAESLLRFICEQNGDEEPHMRVRVYYDACKKLKLNPDAKIPGWPAMHQLLGGECIEALRLTFMPGSDVSHLTRMAERYVYDESDDRYIDRERFFTAGRFVHESPELERRHKGDRVRVGGKAREAFKIFEASDMRRRIGARDLYPDLPPGGIYRISSFGDILPDESDLDKTELTVFNTWRGWPIPARATDPALLAECESMLNQLLGWLSRDNPHQIEWFKKWVAWTIQYPGQKQQIAPVIVGGQGVGKSFLGNVFMKALMRTLWGTASPKMLEGAFSIEPFIDKMFVFMDEARFHGDASTDEIKKLIRNVEMGGAEKYQSARTYRIFARVMFASNRFDMNIGQANVQDRALFYMKAYDRDFLKMTGTEFRTWAEGLKPWFDKFGHMLSRLSVIEHYMHYFSTMEVTRHEVESVQFSSSLDPDIVSSNMAWPRRVAKFIIEDGRIFEDLDLVYPFTMSDLNHRVVEVCKELGMQSIAGSRVMAEFAEADLVKPYVENGRNYYRFTHKLGSITKMYGDTISVALNSRFQFVDEDFGENTCTTFPQWR